MRNIFFETTAICLGMFSFALADSGSVETCEPSVETCALEVCRGNADCDSYLSSSSFLACTVH